MTFFNFSQMSLNNIVVIGVGHLQKGDIKFTWKIVHKTSLSCYHPFCSSISKYDKILFCFLPNSHESTTKRFSLCQNIVITKPFIFTKYDFVEHFSIGLYFIFWTEEFSCTKALWWAIAWHWLSKNYKLLIHTIEKLYFTCAPLNVPSIALDLLKEI